ncbi:MAG: plasmid pRiA4b ORF-3 family protein [Burkholderiaceae bacterium]|jgi:hypothetical protein|nr:plasmid pRiA4b ORF-3 family protein [Burkholderiaceae bacterium]
MVTAKKSRPPKHVYQLRIELAEIVPRVWRTILVPDTTKLAKLDRIIQEAFGWTNSHLHEFRIQTRRYGMTDVVDEFDDDDELLDDRKFTLGSVLSDHTTSFIYAYDFGDGWEHLVVVENAFVANESNDWPVCIAGENACPPEDVGGVGGYEDFVEIITDPTHEDYLSMYRWCGGPFDPSGFDVNSANARIRRLR